MSRTLMSVRLGDDELAALHKAAAEDHRPVAAMARLLIRTGLQLRGYLPPESQSEPATKKRAAR